MVQTLCDDRKIGFCATRIREHLSLQLEAIVMAVAICEIVHNRAREHPVLKIVNNHNRS